MGDKFTVYRFFNGTGQLLYIGMTSDPDTRFRQHGRDKQWWPEVKTITIETFTSRLDASEAEMHAINTEHPIYNTRCVDRKPDVRFYSCPHCGGEIVLQKGNSAAALRDRLPDPVEF